ncbi:MAG: hypothetical protein GY759_03175, partial [Chloroflexi bacterium]|nr:hypothetical protein [Chloroflexota bacterium]
KVDELEDTDKNLSGRLTNKNYVSNAPKEVVSETRTQLSELRTLKTRLKNEIEKISNTMS